MTITLQNVDYQFLDALKRLLSLRKDIKMTTESDELNELTEQVLKDSEAGRNLSPVFTSTSDFMAALNA
nr:hypothetical protein [Treponema sp.]